MHLFQINILIFNFYNAFYLFQTREFIFRKAAVRTVMVWYSVLTCKSISSLVPTTCKRHYYYFQLTHCSLQGLLCDLVQTLRLSPPSVSTRVTTREHLAAEGGTVDGKCPEMLPKCRFPRYIQGSFTCRKATTWDRQLYFPSEGRRAEDRFAIKIRRLRPGANPRTCVPKDVEDIKKLKKKIDITLETVHYNTRCKNTKLNITNFKISLHSTIRIELVLITGHPHVLCFPR